MPDGRHAWTGRLKIYRFQISDNLFYPTNKAVFYSLKSGFLLYKAPCICYTVKDTAEACPRVRESLTQTRSADYRRAVCVMKFNLRRAAQGFGGTVMLKGIPSIISPDLL